MRPVLIAADLAGVAADLGVALGLGPVALLADLLHPLQLVDVGVVPVLAAQPESNAVWARMHRKA